MRHFLRRRISVLVIGAVLATGASTALAPRAHAIDPTIRSILVGGMYGIVAGTALGLVSYPFTGSVRGIFMGTSIGMYLGAVAGGYYVTNKDDPYNPLRRQAGLPGSAVVAAREGAGSDFWISAVPAEGAPTVQVGLRVAAF